MQQKNINFLLLNSLLNTDFLFFKKHFFFKNLNTFNIIKLNKNLFFHLFNPLDLIINLKQFSRVIKFFKNQKSSILNFFVSGVHEKSIINNFILLNKLKFNFKIYLKFLVQTHSKSFQFLLILKELLYKQFKFSNILLNKHLFLIQEINTNQKQNNFNSYKIFTQITDYKKLIFLLTFIQQIIKNSIV